MLSGHDATLAIVTDGKYIQGLRRLPFNICCGKGYESSRPATKPTKREAEKRQPKLQCEYLTRNNAAGIQRHQCNVWYCHTPPAIDSELMDFSVKERRLPLDALLPARLVRRFTRIPVLTRILFNSFRSQAQS